MTRFKRWLAGAWRNRRIGLLFLLTPGVALLMVAASYAPQIVPSVGQEVVLIVGSVVLLLLLPVTALPEDARADYRRLRRWLLDRPMIIAVPFVVALLAAYFFFGRAGVSWAALALPASLLLWLLSIVLYQARHFVSPAWPRASWAIAIVDVLLVVLPSVLIYWLVIDTIEWKQAVVLFVAVPLVLLVLRRVFTAERLEAALRRRGTVVRPSAEGEQAAAEPRAGLAIASATCAIASAMLLLATAVRVPIERRLIETSQVAERGPALPAFELGDLAATERRAALFARFSPVLRMHANERWPASDASRAIAALDPKPDEKCDHPPCDEAALEEVLDRLDPERPLREFRVFPGGAVYPRLVRVADQVDDAGDAVPPVARSVVWLVQYWLFYPQNNWRASSGLGRLTQVHGGDWEWVGVGVDNDGRPQFVAYSAHCAGTWRPWRETAAVAYDGGSVIIGGTANEPRRLGRPPLPSHPLVTVALGSHANYATPGVREPDWTSCRGGSVAARPVRWLTFAAAAREGTPDLGPFQIPAVLSEADTEREARRPIWWGAEGETRLAKISLASDEHGPPSPAYQGVNWDRPIEEIFQTDWECDAGGGRRCGWE
jgi:hypothetical protein